MTRKQVSKLLARKAGITLDISYGNWEKQAHSVRLGPGGDIDRDPRIVPFPLPSGCATECAVTHVLEYLPPEHFFAFFDELHRVMRPNSILYVKGPYGGEDSMGWISDPTHQTRIVEATFSWLDPRTPLHPLQESERGRKPPMPWFVMGFWREPGTLGTVAYKAMLARGELNRRKV